MSAYRLPAFNVSVSIWRGSDDPAADPPAITLDANVSLGRRVMVYADSNAFASAYDIGVGFNVFIRIAMVPAGTDVRGGFQSGGGAGRQLPDWIEVPSGSGAYYKVLDVADMAKGFPNEHRVVAFIPSAVYALPTPLP